MNSPPMTQPRLLVVEDEPAILHLVQDTLQEEGYRITSALSLPASLVLLQEQVFHLVLTDLFQPSGHDPLQSISPLLTEAPPIPVGIMTAWEVPEAAVLQAGAAFLMRKPFELDDLVRAVQQEVPLQPSQVQWLVEQFFAALLDRDWPRVAQLCTPDVLVVPLSAQPWQGARGLLCARPLLERRFLMLPGYRIEHVVVLECPLGAAARYTASWQGQDGVRTYHTGALRVHVVGERIAHIEGAF